MYVYVDSVPHTQDMACIYIFFTNALFRSTGLLRCIRVSRTEYFSLINFDVPPLGLVYIYICVYMSICQYVNVKADICAPSSICQKPLERVHVGSCQDG